MLYIMRKNGELLENHDGVEVDFNYDRDGDAQCFTDDKRVFRLSRAKIDVAGANGMLISGVEGQGLGLTFQEWWLTCLK